MALSKQDLKFIKKALAHFKDRVAHSKRIPLSEIELVHLESLETGSARNKRAAVRWYLDNVYKEECLARKKYLQSVITRTKAAIEDLALELDSITSYKT